MLDRLRGMFIYAIAVVLPLAGILLAVARFAARERDEALRVAAATLLGILLYALVFLG